MNYEASESNFGKQKWIMKLKNRFLEIKNGFRYLIIDFWKAKMDYEA